MRKTEITTCLALLLGLLLAGPGCPGDDDDATDDDGGDDDTADDDDDAGDDDASDDDTSDGFCEQDGASLPDIFDPLLGEDCPFPGLADLVSAEAACATTLDSVVNFEVMMAGNPYTFEPEWVCAISPLTVRDKAQTTSFSGFGLIFPGNDTDFLLIALLDTAQTPEDTWVSAADPLCPASTSAQRGRLLTYARFGNACYLPGLTGEAAAWFDLYADGVPNDGDYYVAEVCASLSEWDMIGPKAKITGSFQAVVGEEALLEHTIELPELCP